ncbi:hypothetical protein M486_3422 [Yersinia pestis 1045]|uniref:Uncharacterized protein n=1 Tax=Yersinia pestis TaxID=632 RepID=A0AAX2I1Y9_YERPE|nr:hypothetical protein YPC_1901 [Yersinia pestis biovar Medievalis str. Harbin 35]AIN16402.1 hypothetical protein DJ40_117 [Yersinia pseudotuberculosis]AJI93396.1 hypothetical protein CH59_3848 [Yersinia pestis]AJI98504.1 hypothetical protein BZ18_2870 [Yersinia pestis Pestoides F]AJJ55377.1 hypothetical protein BZ17_270 [Yersinia pseudotuberculosis IP 32953]AJJ59474.1 hypothetical protein BZ22_2538 [Yersinia pseudotuberculosis YPIII]AJJ68080.1 hypothetical protein BZ16_1551 [Yersinia pseudo
MNKSLGDDSNRQLALAQCFAELSVFLTENAK